MKGLIHRYRERKNRKNCLQIYGRYFKGDPVESLTHDIYNHIRTLAMNVALIEEYGTEEETMERMKRVISLLREKMMLLEPFVEYNGYEFMGTWRSKKEWIEAHWSDYIWQKKD